jgi:hypothetical protein
MGNWMRYSRIKSNGTPGEYDMHRSPVEVGVIGLILTSVVGLGAWNLLTTIQVGREVVIQGSELRALQAELALRVDTAKEQHSHFLTKEDFLNWLNAQPRT